MGFLKISSSPHLRHEDSTRSIMLDVIIALCPALIWGVYVFGARALVITLISILSAVFFEYLYRKITKKNNTVSDLSAAVTGMLLALTLPATVPLWLPAIGSFFAIVIVKQLYGGIGKNVVNPALAARVFLFLAFPTEMATYTPTFEKFPAFAVKCTVPDALASATPLASLKAQPLADGAFPSQSIEDAFFGNLPGCIGELSVLLILAGALYLFVRRVISWQIPFTYIATVAIISYLLPPANIDAVRYTLYELCTGGLMLGAFFMATDYTTSPLTSKGRIIYGIGCGLITMFIRACGGYSEGVSFAILVMNCLAWYIDKFTRPRIFGGEKNGK